jgi:hypothetical protein
VSKKRLFEQSISLPEVLVIHSTEKIYRLAWALGNLLDIPLAWAEPIVVENNKNDTSVHDCQRCTLAEMELEVKLFANRGTKQILLNTRPPADFLLILQGVNNDSLVQDWLPLLKKQPYWSMCYHLDDSKRQSLLPVLYL